ncbi:retrotransposon protein, putative, ty1-copia subclass, partial [Tanacetum coccineum]
TQLYGVDYEETFSPVADIRAIRILISIAAYYDYEIWQTDIKTAFLNGYLDEDIHMVQPEGFIDPNHPIKASGNNVTFLILYVEDIIIMGNHILSLQSVNDYLGRCFAIKDLGEAAFILGIKIYRDMSKRLIGIGQNAYMDKILKRYRMDNSKRGHIPMQEKLDFNKTQGASTPKEVKHKQNIPYALAMGSIMYEVAFRHLRDAFSVVFGLSLTQDTVMSDSEDSTVTYTNVSSLFVDLPDIGSPGVDGPPMMPKDPYAYVVATFQVPPSPDYMRGPEYPPSPYFVPEPVYPEFMPPEDEVLLVDEHPLPVDALPTADSPGYVPKSDPEENPEEDDDEDTEEDPADYPADRGDDGDDEDESSDDDEVDDVDIEEDAEDTEHPAPANSTAIALLAVD